ncbi:hypothetical protein FEMY_19480 [Ferrovum myxofaciens]|uniref:Uncharacterized protein n=1 Tax=Ferrovum myxofaciens TaxID=416213 RepID=A0A149VX92_9PROT|nr:hypothetical protein FEMY_19480 [Ferrovum myxofaciens]
MLKPLEAAKAKERQLRKPADSVSQNSDDLNIRTDESVASKAGVSRDTVRKVEAIIVTVT